MDVGTASTTSAHTVRKVTVVASTSRHGTRRPHIDHCPSGQPYHAHNTVLVGHYGVRIVTYSSVVKVWPQYSCKILLQPDAGPPVDGARIAAGNVENPAT